jgi:leucyl aminopeptidase (aminopeptidase T)
VSSPGIKNIPVATSGKSAAQLRPSTATRGAIAIVTTVRWDAMDAMLRLTSATLAYGEVVRVRRPGAGVKLAEAKVSKDDGGNKAGHQDDHV